MPAGEPCERFSVPSATPGALLSRMLRSLLAAPLLVAALLDVGAIAQDATARPTLVTRWAAEVGDTPHPDYPRPQLVRERWQNLDGMWQLALTKRESARPAAFPETVLVPFPIESKLSGVTRAVSPEQRAWYRRSFTVPAGWRGDRIFLRFGAVDWETEVWVDGTRVGEHRGGYDPFAFDVTGALDDHDAHELVVVVWDPGDAGFQPRGKQVRIPSGIWYTSSTGIWQTVWLEPVPERRIDSLHLVPALDPPRITVRVNAPNANGLTVEAHASFHGTEVAVAAGPADRELTLAIPDARPWSPESPDLYDLTVVLRDDAAEYDRVRSYFGLREIAVRRADDGHLRLFLNGKPRFQLGLLDQGFWPDGLYTAPTDDALRHDLEITKRLGFDLIRKHVKVEPDRFYACCDSMGLLVWQDVPSGDRSIGSDDPDIRRTAQSAREFELETGRILDALQPHPCIVMWVPFNEGWGQFDTERIAGWIHDQDPTRLVDAASGWADRGVGDVHDVHAYPGPALPPSDDQRARVLGEFGGLGLPLAGHTWAAERNWGYRSFSDRDALTDAYVALTERLRPLIADGLAAAVYTQTTDVEIEVNGLMTYDRAVLKVDADRVAAANRALRRPPPKLTTVVPSSREAPQSWRYTLDAPPSGWEQPEFDDAAWRRGDGGFGTPGTPGAVVGTEWRTPDIWIRRSFVLPDDVDPAALRLLVHHDEDVAVFVDGVEAAVLDGYTTGYVTAPLAASARGVLRPGTHLLAIHCRQTSGGQFVDAGLVEWREQDR